MKLTTNQLLMIAAGGLLLAYLYRQGKDASNGANALANDEYQNGYTVDTAADTANGAALLARDEAASDVGYDAD